MIGILAGTVLVLSSVCFVIFTSSSKTTVNKGNRPEELVVSEWVRTIPDETQPDRGIGASNDRNLGRVGLRSGPGEGSETVPRKAAGGGGGGQQNSLEAQKGKPPQPSPIPAAIPLGGPGQPPSASHSRSGPRQSALQRSAIRTVW
jgi:hypothetical protein